MQKGRLDDAYRKVARLEGEVAELTSALEQKQEVVAALQVCEASVVRFGRQLCATSAG